MKRALIKAKKFAKQGPRVAAVLQIDGKFFAVPGFIDGDDLHQKQVRLVTPDGKVWRPVK